MGKKKGKKSAGDSQATVVEGNGDNIDRVSKEQENLEEGMKKLDLKAEGKPNGEADDIEFFEPSDDERSKKKNKKKKKNNLPEEESEPQKEPENVEPEFYEPSDDEKPKKKKNQKKNTDIQTPLPTETQPQEAAQDGEGEFYEPSDDEKKSKKKKKSKSKATEQSVDDSADKKGEEGEDNEEGPIIKPKAQKLAEKKEREKKKKERLRQEKAKQGAKSKTEPGEESQSATADKEGLDNDAESQAKDDKTSKKKKDKKSKKEKSESDPKTRKKPTNKMLAAMQENLKKMKEEEERLKQEEEEKERREEEAHQARLAKLDEEKMKKERRKQKEKDRIARKKAEGTYLTPAQREAQKKREAYVEMLKAQGLLPTAPKERPKYQKRPQKKFQKSSEEKTASDEEKGEEVVEVSKEEEKVDVKEEEEDVADDWEDAFGDSESEDGSDVDAEKKQAEDVEGESDDDDESDSESEEESESEDESDEDDLNPRQRAEKRISVRKLANEKNRSTDDLRSPVICVMGHVDTGKTKILDKIRHSHVQDGEAGGITQQIGATFVPLETIREQTSMVKDFQDYELQLPGLLVIDTPGHESFSNLRSRGSSVCDMAILVVDIMHGLEPQTIESITMLKKRKTPFVVALNKVDRLYDWKRGPESDIINTMKKQKRHVKDEFEERVKEIVVEFAKQELNVKLFHENDDPVEWISMVPTSAHSGDGMGNLIGLVMKYSQSMLPKRLAFSEELQCTVLEVKAIQGLGTTIDVILTNGRLKCGDTIVIAGVEGPIVTHIKGLLMPQPLKELRVKNPYNKFDQLKSAQGVKILAKDLDKALAGTQLLVAHKDDEIELLKEEVQSEVDKMLRGIKLQDRGVFVQASTLGSLEALLEFLKTSKIPYAGIGIGPVHKRDIMKASVMLEHDTQWAVILAFDVKVEREAQELADSTGVKIFTADIIYHLFDSFMQHREDLKKQKQDEFRSIAVFPCKIRIMPNNVFKTRDPIVCGVTIDAGQLRRNTPICVPSKDFLTVGYITSMEFNHKPVEIARVGQEVCVKIETPPGEPPKMVGRHFEETDILVSKISRESINALKDWFRDEMQKTDWHLVIELKKMFEIM